MEIWQTAAAVIVSLGGGGLIVFALSSWLGKVWAARILEQDRAKYTTEIERLKGSLEQTNRAFQAEIDKTLFVSKTHFETEFDLLREIWASVSAVRTAMSQLRLSSRIGPVDQTREQQNSELNERFGEFNQTLNRLRQAVDDNSPFYPTEIFVVLDRLILTAQSERDDIKLTMGTEEAFSFQWYKRGRENFMRYMEEVEKVSALIRERLAKLSVRPAKDT
jgi:hypothetical protein